MATKRFPANINHALLDTLNAAPAIAEAQPSAGGEIRVSAWADEQSVFLTISDNDAGIPESIQNKVFDQFFTTKPVAKGTGQGLSIARSIVVEAHGGVLCFESELGKGMTFTVRLPIDGSTLIQP